MHHSRFVPGSISAIALTAVSVVVLCFGSLSKAAIITITSHEGSSTASPSQPTYVGQSFTTPSGGPWNNVTVDFFSNSTSTTPEATGDLYLLNQPYTGTPPNLSSSTPGFLAEATTLTVAGGGQEHSFATSVQLASSTQYFVYEDAPTPASTFYFDTSGSGGQTYYQSPNSTTGFSSPPVEANFLVQGTVATPEPASLTLFTVGGVGLLLRRRRQLVMPDCG